MKKDIVKNDSTLRMVADKGFRDQVKLALPSHINSERFMRGLITYLRSNKSLLDCDPYSVAGGAMRAAQMGLELGADRDLVHLIKYGNQAQLQISYKGLKELMLRSPDILAITVRFVRKGEEFSVEYGLDEDIVHTPNVESGGDEEPDESQIIASYAIARMRKPIPDQFIVLFKKDIERIRSTSKQKNGEPWTKHYSQMALKSALKNLSKYMHINPELGMAVKLDNLTDIGEDQKNSEVFDVDKEEPVKSSSQELADEAKEKVKEFLDGD